MGSLDLKGIPRVGETIAEKYIVEGLLGAGGMGAVVAARHIELGQSVAIKFLLPEVTEDGESVARFLREARAAAGIQSEHVARVFDVARLPGGAPYMVMERLAGSDLDKLVRTRGALPIAEAVDYVLQASEAIAEAHVRGIVHRDLKPSNLFVTRRADGSPLVKVLDFGISKVTGDGGNAALTATSTVMGSPFYMSPEQVRSSKNVDLRTDVWALGAILDELLTARPTFGAETVSGAIAKIIADPPPPLRSARPDAPAALEALLLGCLEKDVGRRIPDLGVLARALAPFAPASQSSVERISRTTGVSSAVAMQETLHAPSAPASFGGPAVSPGGSPTPPSHLGSSPAFAGPPGGSTSRAWTPAVTLSPAGAAPSAPRAPVALLVSVGAVVALAVLVGGVVALRGRGGAPASAPPAATVSTTEAPSVSVVPAAPSAEATASPPAVAPTIEVRLAVTPPGARVDLDGALVKDARIVLARDGRAHKLLVSAPGFVPQTREITAGADQYVTVDLARAAAAPGGGKRGVAGPMEKGSL